MTLKRFERLDDEEHLKEMNRDIITNLSIEDLSPLNLRTVGPTTTTLGRGRFAIVELSGVPFVYYNTVAGVLYRIAMTAV